jgi:hypothetical protein
MPAHPAISQGFMPEIVYTYAPRTPEAERYAPKGRRGEHADYWRWAASMNRNLDRRAAVKARGLAFS